MTCEESRQAIQDRVDGALDEAGRRRLSAHLAGCADCRALAADLDEIRRCARSLEPMAPPDAVWSRLAGQLRAEGARLAPARGGSFARAGLPWLAAAALLVAAVGTGFLLLRRPIPGPGAGAPDAAAAAPGNADAEALVESVEAELKAAEQHYEAALASLERMSQADDRIEAAVAQTLRQNVALVDRAIADSRTALRGEPQSVPARESLFEALRRKVGLVQDTIALVNEMRKGNQAGAAEIVEGLKKS